MREPSLADCVVSALAEVRAMGGQMSEKHPMLDAVKGLQRTAEQILSDATRQVESLSYQAKRLVRDYEDATKAVAGDNDGGGK